MGAKFCRYDSQSPGLFGGEKLQVEWLPDGEILVHDGLDPDLSFALIWWQRESCWFEETRLEYEDMLINHDTDSPALANEVNRRRQDTTTAQAWFYDLLRDRT